MFKPTRTSLFFTYVALLFLAAFILIPVLFALRLSLDGSIKSVPTEFYLLPRQLSPQAYLDMIHSPTLSLNLIELLRNSLIVSLGASFSAIIFGAGMAYAFARLRFPGRQPGLFALLVGIVLPPVAMMTPLYILLSSLGIRTSIFGLILVYTAFSMPFCIWNLRAAFHAVPVELEEAAFLDGASRLIAFFRVTLPLAAPSIAVAALVAFLAGYTEFAIGWLFVESSQNVTLAMAVWSAQGDATWPELAALALMMTLPVLVIFFVLQKLLIERLTLGITHT